MLTTDETTDFSEIARLLVEEAARAPEPDGGASQAPEVPADNVEAMTRRLEDLPKELGVLLASVGVLGFVLPGIAGTPALIAGGLVLWPRTFGRVESWFEDRFPVAHRKSMQQVGRFLDDLDRRYPITEKPGL